MDAHQSLLHRLAQPSDTKIVLLVLDGVGDLRNASQPQTALEAAEIPNLDALAARASLGRLVPVARGVTPGSGPGHLGLFGYDPVAPEVDVGRGIFEVLGLGLDVPQGAVAARGNFASADAGGKLTDRRAGRIPSSECERLCKAMRAALEASPVDGLDVTLENGEGHRFALLLQGEGLSAALDDTDPQELGVAPHQARASAAEGEAMAVKVQRLVEVFESAIVEEPQANRVLLRGFSQRPALPSLEDLYALRCGAFAGYPFYRGVAAACGMEVVPCGKRIGEIVDTVAERWDDFDFFFLHVKQTDQAGEDGDLATKVKVLEETDVALPRLLELGPDVIAVTGDHSTPAPMASHSWHPIPLLLAAENAFVDASERFDELGTIGGTLGTLPSRELFGLLLAHAGRLEKFGA